MINYDEQTAAWKKRFIELLRTQRELDDLMDLDYTAYHLKINVSDLYAIYLNWSELFAFAKKS
jgi:hypothetical protein